MSARCDAGEFLDEQVPDAREFCWVMCYCALVEIEVELEQFAAMLEGMNVHVYPQPPGDGHDLASRFLVKLA